MSFAGKRALVTGAGSGIGAAVARRLAAGGANVVLADVALQPVEALALELGGQPLQLDVRDEGQVAGALSGLDVLVNAAGIGSTTTAPETPLDVWEDVFAVNARGTFLCCKHAIPGMAERGGGSIVNVASIAALVGLRNRAAYCASKGAVVALTRGARGRPRHRRHPRERRLSGHGRHAVGASPRRGRRRVARRSARAPAARSAGLPEEIADAVAYLASDAAAFVTGTTLVIDGGLTAA